MNQTETLLALLKFLEEEKIPYFLTGSFASNLHGVPRMTQDADLLIQGTLNQFLEFGKHLPQEFYVSEEAIREAVARGGLFNIIHVTEGFKFDMIPLQKIPFDSSRFARKVTIDWEGRKVYFSSAEDTILAKLLWASRTGSERQLADAQGVLDVQADRLDWSYLERWAEELKIQDLLKQLKKPGH